MIQRFGGEPGDLLFLVADASKSVTSARSPHSAVGWARN